MNPLWLAALLPAILIGGCRTIVGPSETEAELAKQPQERLPVDLEMDGNAVILPGSGVTITGTTPAPWSLCSREASRGAAAPTRGPGTSPSP